jgi:hypothetical protein
MMSSSANAATREGLSASTFTQSAEEMFSEFTERIRELETLSLLRTNPMSEQDIKQFGLSLTKAENLMDELARTVEKDRLAISKAKIIINRLKDVKTRGAKLERHLISVQKKTAVNAESESEAEQAEQLEEESENNEDNTIKVLSKANQQFGPIRVNTPSAKQFETVPKYMRSILVYDDFCKICELINMAAERKRLILEAPADRLGPNARAALAIWKSQQTDDLSNLTFITDEDVVTESENDRRFKPNDIKAALQCLRNLDFVRVSPFEQVNRYVFLK